MRTQKLVVAIAALSSIASLFLTMIPDAEAQRGRRGRGRRSASEESTSADPPASAAIAPALEVVGVHWGLTASATFEHFRGRTEEGFGERISKAGGAIEEDRIRHQMEEEIRRLRGTYVAFDGDATGWDTSFLRDEYTHGNTEAMMEVREPDTHSRSYYFFIGDRLWKRYQAFDTSAFGDVTFAQFAEAIQRQFGPGVERTGSLVEGRPETSWIEWQDATTRLRAIDETRFYGFFCLVFEDREVLGRLPTLRTHTITRDAAGHPLVESVIRDDTEGSAAGGAGGGDSHADVADRITGSIRRRSDAPEGGTGSASSGGSSSGGSSSGGSSSGGSSSGGSSSGGSSSGGSRGRTGTEDDPFAGMDL